MWWLPRVLLANLQMWGWDWRTWNNSGPVGQLYNAGSSLWGVQDGSSLCLHSNQHQGRKEEEKRYPPPPVFNTTSITTPPPEFRQIATPSCKRGGETASLLWAVMYPASTLDSLLIYIWYTKSYANVLSCCWFHQLIKEVHNSQWLWSIPYTV